MGRNTCECISILLHLDIRKFLHIACVCARLCVRRIPLEHMGLLLSWMSGASACVRVCVTMVVHTCLEWGTWHTNIYLQTRTSNEKISWDFAYDAFSQQVLTKWYDVWKLRKVFSYFAETFSVLKEPIHLNIIMFNHCLLHFCT